VRLRDDPSAHLTHDENGLDVVVFSCPACDGDCIYARFVRDRPAYERDADTFVWHAEGEFPDTLTLTPSVHAKESRGGPTHWHGHVTNGVAG